MKKLVFVSLAILGGISEGMFNAQDELQNSRKSLTHAKFPANEGVEEERNQIGNLEAQISRLTTLVETSLANAELKNKEKEQSEVYNYQIGDLRAQISRLTTLAETALANKERKDEEKKQSEVYNYQIGNLGAQISKLTEFVQNLNEKVAILSEEKDSLIAKSSAKRKGEAKSEQHQEKEPEINQQEKESNSDNLAVKKKKPVPRYPLGAISTL